MVYWNSFIYLNLSDKIKAIYGNLVKKISIERKTVYLEIQKVDVGFLFQSLLLNSIVNIKSVVDIVGVDYPDHKKRFLLVYNCLSLRFNFRFLVKVYLKLFDVVKTVSKVFSSCDWLEREVWDMFGIFFEEHDDLRRILTDYGFEGFPLRKDFPLTGFNEVRYNDESSCIIYEPLEIAQEFRYFNFRSPWGFRN